MDDEGPTVKTTKFLMEYIFIGKGKKGVGMLNYNASYNCHH